MAVCMLATKEIEHVLLEMTHPVSHRFSLLVLLLALTSFAAYWPGLTGGFYLDDHAQILQNPFVQPEVLDWSALVKAAHSSLSGPTGRPLSMLTFAFGYSIYGLDPWAMKLVNVGIHICNGLLVYLLVHLLVRYYNKDASDKYALLPVTLAGLWMLHPLQVSSVLYIVQRMTLLSAFFMLLGLVGYVYFRGKEHRKVWMGMVVLCVCTVIATLAKENGLLAPVYAALIEWFIFRFRDANKTQKRALIAFFVILPIIIGIALAIKLLYDPEWINRAYSVRTFTPLERLLTEARALFFYQEMIVVPDLGAMGLYHDDFPLSHDLFHPAPTFFAVLWHPFLLAVAWSLRKRYAMVALGIFWFYASHILESTIVPLELVFEHRNYLALAGLWLALLSVALPLLRKPTMRAYSGLLLVGLVAIFGGATTLRAADWGDFFGHALMEAKRHPDSARSQFEAAQTLARGIYNDPQMVEEYWSTVRNYYLRSSRLAPNAIAPLVSLVFMEGHVEHHIDPQVIGEIEDRLKNGKPPAGIGINLHALVSQMLKDGGKLFSEKQIHAIFEAALSNSGLAPRDDAMMRVAYALYLRQKGVPMEKVIALLWRSIDEAPEILSNHIFLAATLIDAGRMTDARVVLDNVAKLDTYHQITKDIHRLEKNLRQVQKTD